MIGIRDWSIRTRLFLAFGGILILFAVVTSISTVASRTIRQGLLNIQENAALDMARATQLRLSWDQLMLATKDYMVIGSLRRIQFEQHATQFEAAFKSLAATPSPSAEERQLIEALRGIVSQIEARSQEALAAPNPLTNRDALATMEALIRLNDYMEPILQRLQEIHLSEIKTLVQRASGLSHQAETMTFAAVLLGAAGAIVLSLLFSGWLSRPILAITRGSRWMAEGDLSQRVDVSSGGELGEAAAAFNEMAKRLEASHRSLQRRNEELAALNGITTISRSLEIQEVLARAVDAVLDLMGLEAGEIFLVDDAAGEVVLAIHRGNDLAAFWERTRFRIGEGVPGMVAASGEPIMITDPARDARFLHSQVIETGFRFYASVPLKAMDRVVGTLGMAAHERHQFSEADMTLLSTVGSQLGGIIENARLFELVRESEQRFRGLITSAQDAVVIVDHHGRIALVNHVAEKIFGYREQELIGQPVTPLMPERYREDHRQGIERYLRTREASVIGRTIELDGLRRSGEEFPMEMSLSVMEHKGSPLFTAIIRDLTERKKLEAKLKSLTDELERKVEERTKDLKQTQAQLVQSGKLAAVGTLAAGVAHELNQPLMVIRGYAQELIADERLADEEIREDLRRIEAQTTRMVAIISHLRDFSRQSKGKRQVTDLNHVVMGALTFLTQQLKTKNIAVVQELAPALPPVWADPFQIEQVLLNLVTNARDAMEGAGVGTITIRTEPMHSSRVALSVTDTGPGIPEDLQTRVFDPFFTTKEVGKGTGLGLSICHGIVEEHGGEFRMESPVADGRGARFTIILPRSLRDDNRDDRA